jgi:hypothetical protein
MRISIFGSVLNTTVPVSRPVGTGLPVVGHRMKMSPVVRSSGDGKIASSEYGMLADLGAVTASLQDRRCTAETFWRCYPPGVDGLRSLWLGWASSAATASQAWTPDQSPFARK